MRAMPICAVTKKFVFLNTKLKASNAIALMAMQENLAVRKSVINLNLK